MRFHVNIHIYSICAISFYPWHVYVLIYFICIKGSAWMLRSCVTRIQILEMGRKWTSRGGSGLGPNMKRIQRRMIFRLHHLTGIVLPAVRINDDSAVSVHFLGLISCWLATSLADRSIQATFDNPILSVVLTSCASLCFRYLFQQKGNSDFPPVGAVIPENFCWFH